MDDEPMWDDDRVVAPTPGSAITIPETANEFSIKDTENEAVRLMMFPLSLTREAKTWLGELNEGTIETWDELRTAFISRFFSPALFDRLVGEIRAFSQYENESLTDAWLRIKEMLRNCHGNSNSDPDKIMARMDAMTIKMDAQYNELQSRAKQPTPDLDDDDIHMYREEEAKFMQTFPKNMLVEVGKFTFLIDFIILEMEEDSKVPLILGRPFLHTTTAVIRVKQKQLNLGVGTERMIFNIDSVIKHSYSNDETYFSIDVINEILEEDFDALLDEGSKILHSIKGTILEGEIFFEFDKFIAMALNENYDSESDEEEPKFEKITINTDYKIKTSLEEPPTDLEHKPLPDNLEYVFLEEPSFLPIIISSQLSAQNKSKLVSVLKKHKEAFAWKTTYISGICPSF
ncbi:reverse transcriptase domain-containing protein [Tanacetum coccineum]|uniref:Reverse transcriptase domain-containing protein n=1 Tax=Tanacetum coccineum TaxID=301880 RepID=A0ABQ5D8H6_9ASTR